MMLYTAFIVRAPPGATHLLPALRSAFSFGITDSSCAHCKRLFTTTSRLQPAFGKKILLPSFKVQVRNFEAHERAIMRDSSRLTWRRTVDQFHFYTVIALAPIFIIMVYTSLFIGDAELADIPEGYEPKTYEYYKSPVSRFIAKTFLSSDQQKHEQTMAVKWLTYEDHKRRRIRQKVKRLMAERTDYKGWYYIPYSEGPLDSSRKRFAKDKEELHGYYHPALEAAFQNAPSSGKA